jgi:hypothetical protein
MEPASNPLAGSFAFPCPAGSFPVKRVILSLLIVGFLAAAVVGCGSNKDKGINRDADKPKSAKKDE